MVAQEAPPLEVSSQPDREISLFALGTILLRNRWRIARWMLFGMAVAAVFAFLKPPGYPATASFLPQGNDASRGGLASFAVQFGVSLPSGGSDNLSPDFYADLLKSRVLLKPVVAEYYSVPEIGERHISFADLFKIHSTNPALQEQSAIAAAQNMVTASVNKATGVVRLSVVTRWPSVSLAIATTLLNGVDQFNLRTRQSQASAERKFVEDRLSIALSDLRAAEDRLGSFLNSNRDVTTSPAGSFARDRLQREVALKQQVYTSLTQSYEDARIKEVRDTPVITVVEAPVVSLTPQPRGRLARLLLGLLLGGFVGALLSLTSGSVRRWRAARDTEVNEFVGTLDEVKGELRRYYAKLRRS